MITAAALAAIVSGRLRLGHVLLGLGIAAKIYPVVLVPLTLVARVAAEGTARGTGLPRRPARGHRRRPRAVPRARAGRRVEQRRAPDDPPAPDREPRRRCPDRARPRGRARGDDALGPRIAEPRRHGAERDRRPADSRPDRGAPHDLGSLRARPRRPRGASARLGRGGGRLRRAREGALASVPDLARPARPARARSPRSRSLRIAARGDRADAALVPVPLLGLCAPVRPDRLVARARSRPRDARASFTLALPGREGARA